MCKYNTQQNMQTCAWVVSQVLKQEFCARTAERVQSSGVEWAAHVKTFSSRAGSSKAAVSDSSRI